MQFLLSLLFFWIFRFFKLFFVDYFEEIFQFFLPNKKNMLNSSSKFSIFFNFNFFFYKNLLINKEQ
jgi:hypothetical protein